MWQQLTRQQHRSRWLANCHRVLLCCRARPNGKPAAFNAHRPHGPNACWPQVARPLEIRHVEGAALQQKSAHKVHLNSIPQWWQHCRQQQLALQQSRHPACISYHCTQHSMQQTCNLAWLQPNRQSPPQDQQAAASTAASSRNSSKRPAAHLSTPRAVVPPLGGRRLVQLLVLCPAALEALLRAEGRQVLLKAQLQAGRERQGRRPQNLVRTLPKILLLDLMQWWNWVPETPRQRHMRACQGQR